MTTRGEVLIAILNNILDFNVARDKHWYRIPKTRDPRRTRRTRKKTKPAKDFRAFRVLRAPNCPRRTVSRPPIICRTHTLPFDRLSPHDFAAVHVLFEDGDLGPLFADAEPSGTVDSDSDLPA